MNFIGHYYHALEQKGRLAIPANYRKDLDQSATITRGLDGCLFLFPKKAWDKVVKEASQMPFTRKDAREWVRILTHNAHQVEFDSQGRILIPDHLRDFANLKGNCVIAGSLDKIEIWQRSRYHKYIDKLEGQAEAIAERLSPSSQKE